jgi:NTE family protein
MFRTSPAAELDALAVPRRVLVTPDDAARAAIGFNILDPRRRAPALAAGAAQASAVAAAVAKVWD